MRDKLVAQLEKNVAILESEVAELREKLKQGKSKGLRFKDGNVISLPFAVKKKVYCHCANQPYTHGMFMWSCDKVKNPQGVCRYRTNQRKRVG